MNNLIKPKEETKKEEFDRKVDSLPQNFKAPRKSVLAPPRKSVLAPPRKSVA